MLLSLFDMAEEGGWLPVFPCWASCVGRSNLSTAVSHRCITRGRRSRYTNEMVGDHGGAVLADAVLSGLLANKSAQARTA